MSDLAILAIGLGAFLALFIALGIAALCHFARMNARPLDDFTFPRDSLALETQRGGLQSPQPSRCTNPVPAGNPGDCLHLPTTPAASVVGGFSENANG